MHFDLLTLYYLAIGTLLLSALMTLWECQDRAGRSREMCILAAGYFGLAVGCALATVRPHAPGAMVPALSSIVMLSGYLLLLEGAAALSGRSHRRKAIALLVMLTATWVVFGGNQSASIWYFACCLPIALASGLTAWELSRSAQLRHLRSRRVAVLISALHALLYLGRATILPLLAERFGADVVIIASKVTMYEGVLYSVAMPAALLAMLREEAHEQLRDASQTDFLTNVGNRRWFFETGESLLADLPATHSETWIFAFYLDHFKAINDRFGHATGDHVLQIFARVVRDTLRGGEIVARLGGEEFAAILRGRSHCDAIVAGERIASRFSRAVAAEPGLAGVTATVSIGIAEHGSHGTSLSELLSAADRALYSAKAQGRNRIESVPDPLQAAA